MPILLRHGFHPSTLSIVFVVSIVLLVAATGFLVIGALDLLGAGRSSASIAIPATGLPF